MDLASGNASGEGSYGLTLTSRLIESSDMYQ